MKPSSIFISVFSVSLAALVSACGNLNVGHQSTVSAMTLSSSILPPANSSTNSKYSCPSSVLPNVAPYDYASSTSGNFQVCINPQTQDDVLVTGNEGGDSVCLFPANSSSPLPDLQGLPTYACGASSATGLPFTFQSPWNSAYIVDGKDAGLMRDCLHYGLGSQYCTKFPNFSYGIFR